MLDFLDCPCHRKHCFKDFSLNTYWYQSLVIMNNGSISKFL